MDAVLTQLGAAQPNQRGLGGKGAREVPCPTKAAILALSGHKAGTLHCLDLPLKCCWPSPWIQRWAAQLTVAPWVRPLSTKGRWQTWRNVPFPTWCWTFGGSTEACPQQGITGAAAEEGRKERLHFSEATMSKLSALPPEELIDVGWRGSCSPISTH